ncbi:hypothetical protein VTK73DRAFT_900 [Phialemonium thermophilum]|uniref:PEBP-like protein n=1 Tax=Phialemonium thermophilum TaxID=223376 RepID=A0ABR3Y3A2_9PEZI
MSGTARAVIEVILSYLFKNQKGRDAKSFYTTPAFASHKEQTIEVTAPDCGPSGATLPSEYTYEGGGRFPTLEWRAPGPVAESVKEWLLVSEDPDAPLSTPVCHGIYLGIPVAKTRVEAKDFELADPAQRLLKGGFYYGMPRRDVVYMPPRPLMNHGVHRYFFEVVALSEPLDKEFAKSAANRDQVAEAIKGKVLGWGMWVGSSERTWS